LTDKAFMNKVRLTTLAVFWWITYTRDCTQVNMTFQDDIERRGGR
jgi:hypothetical protein